MLHCDWPRILENLKELTEPRDPMAEDGKLLKDLNFFSVVVSQLM